MRQWGLEYLACPVDGSPLDLHDAHREGDDIVSGRLVSRSGRSYPIVHGVPRFVGSTANQSEASVESFGFEWNELNFDSFFVNWREHVVGRNFGSLDYFEDRVILECGSGSGMHARWMLENGARRVVSLELSHSVDGILRKNLAGLEDRSLVVQCDIAEAPIRKGSADVIYCINVVQHTEDPQRTTQRLYELLGPSSELYINYYWREEKMPLGFHFRELMRQHVFGNLPNRVTLGIFRVLAGAAMVPGLDAALVRMLLIRGEVPAGPGYLRRKYRQTVLNSYDYYGSHSYQHYFTADDLRRLFAASGIPMAKVTNFDEVVGQWLPGHAFRFVP
jgi:uncharacterized protein YbaR (Trm112 family)/SAM-dependent methyltransferase